MPRMNKKKKLEYEFFINDKGRITYNELCEKCTNECKQSFRATVVECRKYTSKRSTVSKKRGAS